MEEGRGNFRFLTPLNYSLAAIALLSALLAVLLRSITHHPFYDETLQLHLTWLISEGLTPHRDFWCTYPILGCLLTMPLFRLLPETPLILFPLRFFSGIVVLVMGGLFARNGRRVAKNWLWGVAPFILIVMTPKLGDYFAEYSVDHLAALSAVGALVILLAKPTLFRLGGATALALLSLLIMPKYGLPLGGALAAYTIYSACSLRKPGRVLVVIIAASTATVALIWALYRFSGCSLRENLIEGFLFESRYMLFTRGYFEISLWETFFSFLLKHYLIGLLIAGGLIGWVVNGLRKGGVVAWTGSGILIGVLFSLFTLKTFLEQYLAPLLICLAFFVPYLFLLCRRSRWRGFLTLLLLLAVLQADWTQLRLRAGELEETTKEFRDPRTESFRGVGGMETGPAVEVLENMAGLLEIIPEDEKVLGNWIYHPIFRRDLTFITYDERPSFKDFLDPDHKFVRQADPGYFAEILEKDPPGYISLSGFKRHYPPGWYETCKDFVWRNRDNYRKIDLNGVPVFVRRDLLERGRDKSSPEG